MKQLVCEYIKCSAAKPSIPADLPSLVSFKLLRTSSAVIDIFESCGTASICYQYVHKQNSSSLQVVDTV